MLFAILAFHFIVVILKRGANQLMVINRIKSSIDSLLQDIKYKNIIKDRFQQMPVIKEMEQLQASDRYKDPNNLIPFRDKVYSQTDEDGIIREIFNRIGTTNQTFVEFGIGNGLENNSRALLLEIWQGLWIDASTRSVNKIKQEFAPIIERKHLKILESFINKENINDLISSQIKAEEID